MVRQPNESLDAQNSLALKLTEPVVNSNNPWHDDLLDRRAIATRLMKLVATQEKPLSISLHGQWGTGKTFMLKRWQKDLEGQGFKAIYFNAWEDDFCDDPLLAMIGQLSSYFSEGLFKDGVKLVTDSALPLLRSNAASVLTHFTGLTADYELDSPTKSDLIKEYLCQRQTRDLLKKELGKLSAAVYTESNHPLIIVVDELDRCRPTFAIELLERVKHIFDIANIVFVFGVNRDELCKSLSSVYGEINTDVYLRRFFDFEFNLSEVDSQGFAQHLFERFQISEVFRSLENAAGQPGHMDDYNNYSKVVPTLWSGLGLSLRDIDYGIRLLALLAKTVPLGTFTHPFLLSIVIAMKFKSPELYRLLLAGNFRTSEIMDYINGELRQGLIDKVLSNYLDRIEGFLYCADVTNQDDQARGDNARTELLRLSTGDVEFGFQVVSQRAQNADPGHWTRIIRAIQEGDGIGITRDVFGLLGPLIDTCQSQLRR